MMSGRYRFRAIRETAFGDVARLGAGGRTTTLRRILSLLILCYCSAGWAQIAPTAPDLLNTNGTTDSRDDRLPQVTTDGSGNWVAVWHSSENLSGTVGIDADIFVARSADNGVSWTTPALLNTNGTTDTGEDESPQVTTDGSGNWVAVWRSTEDLSGTAGTDWDIFVARSTDNGANWTAPALLNINGTSDSGADLVPQVTTDGSGNWVAVWRSDENLLGTAGTDLDIFVARSTDNGASWTAPALLNTNGTTDSGSDVEPQVTTDGSGNWVAVWLSTENLAGTAGADQDIFVARSTDNGAGWTSPALLNINGNADSGNDVDPQVTTDGSGNWVAVWRSDENLSGTAGTDIDIFVAQSTDNGASWTSPALLNTNGAGDSGTDAFPVVRTDGSGSWVTVWQSTEDLSGTADTDWDIFVAQSTDNGASWTLPALFNTNGAGDSGGDERPQLTTDNSGNWVAVWHSSENLSGAAGSDQDILVSTLTLAPLDSTPPAADTITPSTTGPSNATSVDFTVIFSEDVVNFDAESDLVIMHSGTAHTGASITGSGDTYTVTVSGVSGDGSFTLAVDTGSDVEDAAGNGLDSSVTSADVVIDNIPPTLGISAPSTSATNTGPVSYTVTYSGADSVNVTSGDININATGDASGSVSVTGGTTTTPTVTISGITGDGSLGISIGAGTAMDVAGNVASSAGPAATFTVDNTDPVVTVDVLNTIDSSPPIVGTVDDPAATIMVTVDGQTNPAVNNGDGTWTLADDTLSPLAPATYDVQVSATDDIGNVGMDGTAGELTVASGTAGDGGVIIASLSPGEIIVGATLELMAPSGGTNYVWKKDGALLAEDAPRVTGTTGPMVTFAGLELADSGTYTVEYDNGGVKGIVETEPFVLNVQAGGGLPPGAPVGGALLTALLAVVLAGSALWVMRDTKRSE